MAFGGSVLNEDGTGYAYNGDATVEAMTFLKEMYDEGCAYFFTEGYPNPEFAARRAIFTQGSSSGLPYYASDVATFAVENGTEPDVWGATAIPHTTADPVQNVYGGDVMIPSTTPETATRRTPSKGAGSGTFAWTVTTEGVSRSTSASVCSSHSVASLLADTAGTVRRRASMPGISSTPLAISRAISAVAPWRL